MFSLLILFQYVGYYLKSSLEKYKVYVSMAKYNVIVSMLSLHRQVLSRAVKINARNIATSHVLRKDLYEALGVSKDATQAEIKNAYFELSKKYHPDRIAATDETLNKFREITDAYEILGNEQSRKLYDGGIMQAKGGVPGAETIVDPMIKFYQKRQELHKIYKETPDDVWARVPISEKKKKHVVYTSEEHEDVKRPHLRYGFAVWAALAAYLFVSPSIKNTKLERLCRYYGIKF